MLSLNNSIIATAVLDATLEPWIWSMLAFFFFFFSFLADAKDFEILLYWCVGTNLDLKNKPGIL